MNVLSIQMRICLFVIFQERILPSRLFQNSKGERSLTLARINRRMLRHRNMHRVFCFLDFFNWLCLEGNFKKRAIGYSDKLFVFVPHSTCRVKRL